MTGQEEPGRPKVSSARGRRRQSAWIGSEHPRGSPGGPMTEHEVDVVVIGLGPGGEYAAGELAEARLTVAGVEDSLVGGECPYWGCVPSKMMIRAANLVTEGRRIPGMAGASAVQPDWAPVARRIRDEATDGWDDKVAADRFTGKGGLLFRGHGKIIAPGQVAVGGDVLRARRGIVISTGTVPAIPEIPGLAGTPYWTNHDAIEAEQVPESLTVRGSGAIALELAQVYSRFGARVTVVEDSGRLLPTEEPEAGQLIAEVFRREGIDVRAGVKAGQGSHEPGPGPAAGFTLTLAGGGEARGSALLVATGRRAHLAAVGGGSGGLDGAPPAGPRPAGARCSSPPGGAPTWPRWASAASASTSPSTRCRSTGTCARRRGCGRSATWSARASSRTCPCTTRPSSWPTSSAGSRPRPSTTRCRRSPLLIPRSAASA